MASDNNNYDNGGNGFYEFELTDEIKNLGFTRVYRQDRTLVVIHNPEANIYSKYIDGDLQTTVHHLEKAFIKYDQMHKNFFGEKKIQQFLALFSELKIKVDEQERVLEVHELQKKLFEIINDNKINPRNRIEATGKVLDCSKFLVDLFDAIHLLNAIKGYGCGYNHDNNDNDDTNNDNNNSSKQEDDNAAVGGIPDRRLFTDPNPNDVNDLI